MTLAAAASVEATFAGLPPPDITGFSPAIGGVGTSVAIAGSGFTGATAVTFGGTPVASVSIDSDSRITAVVAVGTSSGHIDVTTPTGAMSDAIFAVLPAPAITGFNPGRGGPGTPVTVIGSNLAGATSVQLHGVVAVFTVVSATQLTFTVPVGAATGLVAVTTPGGTATSARSFVLVALPPVVRSFSPGVGGAGTSVTILGLHLSVATRVAFNGVRASYAVNSDGSITATVHVGAASGPITVTTPGGTAASVRPFTVLPAVVPVPVVSGFSPGSGIRGVRVVIRSSGFTGATQVAFNGVRAAYAVVNDSMITAFVPAGATTGHITVTTSGGTATSAAVFTI